MSENVTIDDRLKGPLSGVRVIEMGQLVAGPFVGSRMADFGAEVIKVESPGRGDAMRHWGHHRYKGRSLWWPVLARNKKTISANLREKRGQDLVRRLIGQADVLVENFKPGTLEKWGLDPESLHVINPGHIMPGCLGLDRPAPIRVARASQVSVKQWVVCDTSTGFRINLPRGLVYPWEILWLVCSPLRGC